MLQDLLILGGRIFNQLVILVLEAHVNELDIFSSRLEQICLSLVEQWLVERKRQSRDFDVDIKVDVSFVVNQLLFGWNFDVFFKVRREFRSSFGVNR